jgi:hypothetical protein
MHISAALPLLLRLRGGADIPDGTGTGTGLRLSREEITAKLNRVPTFCIMQGDGSVISLPDPAGSEGDECCTWFTDAAEAQYTFKRVCAANPELVDEGLRLQTHGLGQAFAMCGGWPREEGEATTEVTLRIKGPSALLKPVESQLVDALRQQGLDPGSWRLPVFIGEELAQATPTSATMTGGPAEAAMTRLPIFFNPYQLREAYERANVPKHAYAKGPSVMDIRALAAHMAEEPVEFPNPWRAVEFICPQEAAELAREIAQRDSPQSGA